MWAARATSGWPWLGARRPEAAAPRSRSGGGGGWRRRRRSSDPGRRRAGRGVPVEGEEGGYGVGLARERVEG